MSLARRLPGLAREALLLELALYRSLVRWVTRRPDVPPGATPIGYSQLVAPMMWLWIFGSTLEVIAVEVVLRHIDQPWAEAIRVPMLVLGIWGVLWMLGMQASNRVRPHLLTDSELRVRSGARTWLTVPLGSLSSTRPAEHELPGVIRTLHVDGPLVLVGTGSRTNLELVLTGPTTLSSSSGDVTVSRVGIWVDEPRAVAAQLRQSGSARAPNNGQ